MKVLGVPVHTTAYTRECVLLLTAALFTGMATVMAVLGMLSDKWIVVNTKHPYPGSPWLSFDLGLVGGRAFMNTTYFVTAVGFRYRDSNKYCPDSHCEALEEAGMVCLVLLSLSIAASLAAILLEVVSACQLGNFMFLSEGPFGNYVNYAKCQRNVVAASISSVLGTALYIAGVCAWAGIMLDNEFQVPDHSGGSSSISWHLGPIWIANVIGSVLLIFASGGACFSARPSTRPFTGYTSLT
ncbi:hypothetical protein HOP50_04g34800 [Chloropicon primus]|uniref:Uncharacterized protein n=1 Tax=Chloropicon primus TaxID=1764295 RepID=A0A5B8MKF2_9CHLO|nr:hypothetical protein A3770_04p34740 [Chloropicon primus]UPR00166.1 hypothetical protein HOP50_04g34800 [Chloropicon primus]|mmetsp:Transcript_14125/g.39998  ORF Transcript_14125/g.39998 Transcript_14125/m.39998 type:complete len:241 (+) Transcript_14125:3254-3976(+)|eukprot:QDZ20956.1 hypothetical protein A3770_04p34740 [Chloropicon primus]